MGGFKHNIYLSHSKFLATPNQLLKYLNLFLTSLVFGYSCINIMTICLNGENEKSTNNYWKLSKFLKIPPGGSCGAISVRISSSWSWDSPHQNSVFKIVKRAISKNDILFVKWSEKKAKKKFVVFVLSLNTVTYLD